MKKQIKILTMAFLTISFLFTGCSKDEEFPTISANEFTITIAENPIMGQSIGTIPITGENYNNIRFYFIPEHIGLAEHVNLNSTTGELTISNPSYFDFEQRVKATGNAGVEVSNSSDDLVSDDFLITINITDVTETPPPTLTVQQRLDGTETPFDIYNSDNALLDSLWGKTYVGGYIFSLNTTTGAGMVAYLSTFSNLPWDFNMTGLVATGAISTLLEDGFSNTNTIVAVLGNGGAYPANICDGLFSGGFGDWFLPSLDELSLMYNNLHAKGFGNFQNLKYWSSSELDANSSWTRDFAVSSGQTSVTVTKTVSHLFRPIRTF